MLLYFVINPAAGKTDQSAALCRTIETVMTGRAVPHTVYITKHKGDGERAVREAAAAAGEDILFVACGGDGTLNEVVNGAMGQAGALVTHFPCGSGNDFVRSFGAAGRAFYQMEGLLFGGAERQLDVICCGGRFCLNICSVGLDARVGADMQKIKRWPLLSGSGAYVLALIWNMLRPLAQKCRVTAGGRAWEGAYILLVAANGTHYGGGFRPVPEARTDDGQLEFLLVKKTSRLRAATVVGLYKQGRYAERMQYFERFSGRELCIAADSPLVCNLDGEILRQNEVRIALAADKLRFWAPAEA